MNVLSKYIEQSLLFTFSLVACHQVFRLCLRTTIFHLEDAPSRTSSTDCSTTRASHLKRKSLYRVSRDT